MNRPDGQAPVDPSIVPTGDEADLGLDAVETRVFTVDAALHGQRLDKAVASAAPEFSRTHLQRLIAGGHVQLEGRACTQTSRRLLSGQRVAVQLVPTDESLAYRPEAMDLAVIHEDEHLLVLDKPAGLVVHPGSGNWSGTLLNGLLARHAGSAALPRAGIVHRLDKDTSGLMVVAKDLPAATGLSRAIAARTVKREYMAVAHGRFPDAQARIDAPIGRDLRVPTRMAVVPAGRPSVTEVRRVAVSASHSALRCRLHTGRTHQIRVHLAHRGHPLVGDVLYGGRLELGMQRQALHATRLAFEHPVTGQALDFECAPPADFAHAWEQVAGR